MRCSRTGEMRNNAGEVGGGREIQTTAQAEDGRGPTKGHRARAAPAVTVCALYVAPHCSRYLGTRPRCVVVAAVGSSGLGRSSVSSGAGAPGPPGVASFEVCSFVAVCGTDGKESGV